MFQACVCHQMLATHLPMSYASCWSYSGGTEGYSLLRYDGRGSPDAAMIAAAAVAAFTEGSATAAAVAASEAATAAAAASVAAERRYPDGLEGTSAVPPGTRACMGEGEGSELSSEGSGSSRKESKRKS